MEDQSQEQQHNGNNALSFLSGMLLGGLAGSAAALLMAPQSGKQTRHQIQHKGIELRNEATGTVQHALAQVRHTAQQITGDVREKAEELQQRGQNLVDEQREHLATLVSGEKNGIKISS